MDRHIEVLLLDNDCVIIPQFGGFVAHYREAIFDKEENVFLPPYRTLGFNPQLKFNDSLLVTSYVETYDISYPEALKRIEKEVNELRQIVENQGSYTIKGLGSIRLNIDGNYTFEPNQSGILTPELYGLGSTDINPVSKYSLISLSKKNKHKEPKNGSVSKAKVIQLKNSIASNIAVAAVVALAFILFSNPSNNALIRENIQQAVATSIENILPQVSPEESAKETLNVIPRIAKPEISKEEKVENKQDSVEKEVIKSYYSVVLASQVSKNNAASFAEKLKKRGFADVKIIASSKGSKVLYGTYTTEAEAYKALSSIHKENDLKDAWVMFVKQ